MREQRRFTCTPHVVKLMTITEAKRLFGDAAAPKWGDPDDQLMVAIWLRAIPDQTGWIVLRPAEDLPEDFLPPRMDGEWIERSGIYRGPEIRLAGTTATATARPCGRIELREDGAVAEVYEVSAW